MPPTPNPDPQALYHALEQILRAPGTGRAVAETLLCQALERNMRCVVADLRARRAEDIQTREADRRDETRLGPDATADKRAEKGPEKRPTPWARRA